MAEVFGAVRQVTLSRKTSKEQSQSQGSPWVNKVKEVSFKIIYKYYPANHYMQKYKKDKHFMWWTFLNCFTPFLALFSHQEILEGLLQIYHGPHL